ncbi:unnamed protein product [Lactuca saligna]|uniref:Protein kinase domain-containing protein n=1 Tax=Lactuca saligna TaxID=75948 RepID=A0AA35ZEX8_LACSI|nr:unnamed protein product [Lactuca saligna]
MSSFLQEFEHLIIPLQTIKDATNNFGEDKFIAEGGYGKVYRGKFLRSEGEIMGAAKRWSLSNKEGDPEFRREIMLLSDNKHENLISLLGFCYENNERILVYEYAPNKSLDFHLQDPNFTWIQRLKVCLGAARGLEYLHNPRRGQRVLHCDIKSANILLDENWNAKIADFGLSKYGPATQNRSYLITQAKGTYGYCDPVFSETMIYTKKSDVYSFGVVLFEVLCSRMCIDFSYNDNRRSLMFLVKESSNELIRDTLLDVTLRQQMAENSFNMFVAIAQQCLETEQTQRPTMELIASKLEAALQYQLIKENPDEAIKRWSTGKEGNFDALLLTLQDILGRGTYGWKPLSTANKVSNRALRKYYQRTVIYFSPDKLQERGASVTEMYICQKVLEILENSRDTTINTTSPDTTINARDKDINKYSRDTTINARDKTINKYSRDTTINALDTAINTNESAAMDFKTLLSLWESR